MSLRPANLRLPLACGALALLAGCTVAPSGSTASSPAVTSPAASASGTVSATPTVSATASASASASASVSPTVGTTLSAAPTASGVPGSSTGGAMPTGPATPSLISAQPGGTVALGTANAFHADGWTLGDYQPAAAPARTQALAATINCNAPGQELEYRFAPTNATLKVSVAQDVLSVSSDNTIDFQIVADGKSVAEKALTFKQTADLSAPLTGVTVVKIVAKSTGACTTSSTALVTKAVVSG